MEPTILPPLSCHDTATVSTLAGTIWRQHYQGIITTDQIHYMLVQRYCPLLIKEEAISQKAWWHKLFLNERIIGFSSCAPTIRPGELKLDKLYIQRNHQRQSYGAKLVANAIQTIRENFCNTLILT